MKSVLSWVQFCLFSAVVIGLAACQTTNMKQNERHILQTIPYDRHKGWDLVKVDIDGQTYTLLLDTGTIGIFLKKNKRTAHLFERAKDGFTFALKSGNTEKLLHYPTIGEKTVRIGNLALPPTQIYLTPPENERIPFWLQDDVEGTLGAPVFQTWALHINRKKETIDFYDSTDKGPSGVRRNMKLFKDYYPILKAEIRTDKAPKPVKLELLVDTGQEYGLKLYKHSSPAFEALTIEKSVRYRSMFEDDTELDVSHIHALQLADGPSYKNIKVYLLPKPANRPAGVIGNGLLGDEDLYINYNRGIFYIYPKADQGEPKTEK